MPSVFRYSWSIGIDLEHRARTVDRPAEVKEGLHMWSGTDRMGLAATMVQHNRIHRQVETRDCCSGMVPTAEEDYCNWNGARSCLAEDILHRSLVAGMVVAVGEGTAVVTTTEEGGGHVDERRRRPGRDGRTSSMILTLERWSGNKASWKFGLL